MKLTRISLAIGLFATIAVFCGPLRADPILPTLPDATYQLDYAGQNVNANNCPGLFEPNSGNSPPPYTSPGSYSCSTTDYAQYAALNPPGFPAITAYTAAFLSPALTVSIGANTEGSNLDGFLGSDAQINFEVEAFYIGATPQNFGGFTIPVIETLAVESDASGPHDCYAAVYSLSPTCGGTETVVLNFTPNSPYSLNFGALGDAGVGNGSFDLTATLTYAIDTNQSDWNTNSQIDTNPADYVLVYSADVEAAQDMGTAPEPATCLLLATGVAMLHRLRRRK